MRKIWGRFRLWLDGQYLVLRLAVPTLLAGAALFAGSLYYAREAALPTVDRDREWKLAWANGLLASLATTCLGILITVYFVERLQRRQERRQWTRASWLANRRIAAFAGQLCGLFDTVSLWKPVPHDVGAFSPPAGVCSVSARVSWIATEGYHVVDACPSQYWEELVERLRLAVARSDELVDVFVDRLEPGALADLLEANLHGRGAIESYRAAAEREAGVLSLEGCWQTAFAYPTISEGLDRCAERARDEAAYHYARFLRSLFDLGQATGRLQPRYDLGQPGTSMEATCRTELGSSRLPDPAIWQSQVLDGMRAARATAWEPIAPQTQVIDAAMTRCLEQAAKQRWGNRGVVIFRTHAQWGWHPDVEVAYWLACTPLSPPGPCFWSMYARDRFAEEIEESRGNQGARVARWVAFGSGSPDGNLGPWVFDQQADADSLPDYARLPAQFSDESLASLPHLTPAKGIERLRSALPPLAGVGWRPYPRA